MNDAKPRRGRPPLPPELRANERIALRCSTQELAAWRAAASDAGVGLSRWVRDTLARSSSGALASDDDGRSTS